MPSGSGGSERQSVVVSPATTLCTGNSGAYALAKILMTAMNEYSLDVIGGMPSIVFVSMKHPGHIQEYLIRVFMIIERGLRHGAVAGIAALMNDSTLQYPNRREHDFYALFLLVNLASPNYTRCDGSVYRAIKNTMAIPNKHYNDDYEDHLAIAASDTLFDLQQGIAQVNQEQNNILAYLFKDVNAVYNHRVVQILLADNAVKAYVQLVGEVNWSDEHTFAALNNYVIDRLIETRSDINNTMYIKDPTSGRQIPSFQFPRIAIRRRREERAIDHTGMPPLKAAKVVAEKHTLATYLGLGTNPGYIGPINGGLIAHAGPDLDVFRFEEKLGDYYYPGYTINVSVDTGSQEVSITGVSQTLIEERQKQAFLLVPNTIGFKNIMSNMTEQPVLFNFVDKITNISVQGFSPDMKTPASIFVASVMAMYVALGTEIAGGDVNIQEAIFTQEVETQLEPILLEKARTTFAVADFTETLTMADILSTNGMMKKFLDVGVGFAIGIPAISHYVRTGALPVSGKLIAPRLDKSFNNNIQGMLRQIAVRFKLPAADNIAGAMQMASGLVADAHITALRQMALVTVPVSADYINVVRFLYGAQPTPEQYPGIDSFASYHCKAPPVGVAKYLGARAVLLKIGQQTQYWKDKTDAYMEETKPLVKEGLYNFIYSVLAKPVLGVGQIEFKLEEDLPLRLASACVKMTDPGYPNRATLPDWFKTMTLRPMSLRNLGGEELYSSLKAAIKMNETIGKAAEGGVAGRAKFKETAAKIAVSYFNKAVNVINTG